MSGRGRPPKERMAKKAGEPTAHQPPAGLSQTDNASAAAQSELLTLQFYENLPFQSGGVYFLIKQERVIYIGQATNLLARLASHQVRDYDSVGFIPAPAELLDELEGYWIAAFHPEHNRAGKIPLTDFVRPELVQEQRQIWQGVVKEWKAKYREWTASKGQIIRRAQEANLRFQGLLSRKGVEPNLVLEYTKRTFGWVHQPAKTKIRYRNANGRWLWMNRAERNKCKRQI
jgi:hypothetical protein